MSFKYLVLGMLQSKMFAMKYSVFLTKMSKSFNEIASFFTTKFLSYTDINDCQPDSCENNGTCIDLVNDYRCDCVAGFNGTICENSEYF